MPKIFCGLRIAVSCVYNLKNDQFFYCLRIKNFRGYRLKVSHQIFTGKLAFRWARIRFNVLHSGAPLLAGKHNRVADFPAKDIFRTLRENDGWQLFSKSFLHIDVNMIGLGVINIFSRLKTGPGKMTSS